MELIKSLRINNLSRLALTGAGGKTTAMFQLAQEYQAQGLERVFLAASTHLSLTQAQAANAHFEIANSQQVADFSRNLPQGRLLWTGERKENDRTAGLDEWLLAEIKKIADDLAVPFIIEADGSRQRPLKAPASHEPPIPDWVDTVVVLAGLSGLGKPINETWVHRPEIFSQLSCLPMDDLVTIDGLAHVLDNEDGGLKNIPSTARPVALLNQADDTPVQAVAVDLGERLVKGRFSSSLVAHLASMEGKWNTPYERVIHVNEPVAGIILAAGGSSRLGQPKQLLEWRGQPLVRKAAQTALTAGLNPVIVVVGAYQEQVGAVLADMPVKIAHNLDWQSGQSTSLIAGLRNLPEKAGAAIFLLADQPQVTAPLLNRLVDMHHLTLAKIIAPLVNGQRANPVLFDQTTFPELLSLKGDTGGRALFSRYLVSWLPWQDERLLLDIDRPEDYQKLLDWER